MTYNRYKTFRRLSRDVCVALERLSELIDVSEFPAYEGNEQSTVDEMITSLATVQNTLKGLVDSITGTISFDNEMMDKETLTIIEKPEDHE